MSGPNLPQFPLQSQSVFSTGKTASVKITPNANLTTIPQAAIDAFVSSARQGPIRGQIIRENKNNSYSVRTKDAEITLTLPPAQQTPATKHASQAPRLQAGDPVQLDFSVDAFTSDILSSGKGLDVQISLLRSTALLEDAPQISTRASETPLHVDLNYVRPKDDLSTISVRLDAISVAVLTDVLESCMPQSTIKQSMQAFEKQGEVNFHYIDNLERLIVTPISTVPLSPVTQKAIMSSASERPQVNIATPSMMGQAVMRGKTNESQVRTKLSSPISRLEIVENPQNSMIRTQIQTTLHEPNKTQAITNKFKALISKPQVNSSILYAPTHARPALQATMPYRAGHAAVQVVGFSNTGTPIVTLHQGEAIPSGISERGGGNVNTPTPQYYFLKMPPLLTENLQVGSQIEVAPQSSTSLDTGKTSESLSASLTSTSHLTAFFLSPGLWPIMSELTQTLEAISPSMAQNLRHVTPSPTGAGASAHILPAAMLFIAAMRGGDLQSWIGHKMVNALRSAGKGELLNHLNTEGQALGRISAEPLTQDWRVITLPFLTQGEMHKVVLYYKHDEHDDNNGEKGKQTRFVFDMALNHMGKVQIDGLFLGQKLDIIIRTGTHFSSDMRQRMRGVYQEALEASGLSGALSFQNDKKSYFTVAPKVDEFEGHV